MAEYMIINTGKISENPTDPFGTRPRWKHVPTTPWALIRTMGDARGERCVGRYVTKASAMRRRASLIKNEPNTIGAFVEGKLEHAERLLKTARSDLARADRIDFLDTIGILVRSVEQAAAVVRSTLPQEMRRG